MHLRFNQIVTFSLVAMNMVPSVFAASSAIRAWNPLDPFGSFLADLADTLNEWYANQIQIIVDTITMVSIPAPDMLVNDIFVLAMGGTYGFARTLVVLIATLIAFVIIITPSARHGVAIQRTVTSMVMVVVMGAIFFPVYSLAYSLVMALIDSVEALTTIDGETTADAILRLFTSVNAWDAFTTAFSSGVSGVFGIFIIIESLILFVGTVGILIGYPLVIAIRPLGSFGNSVFNLFNAGIITTLLSPALMVAGFMLPLIVQNAWPSYSIVASPGFAIVGSLFSVCAPLIIAYLSFKKSKEIFGRLDDASGKFDIGKMPPVSVEEVNKDIRTTNSSSTMMMTMDVVTDSLLYGGGSGHVFDDIVKGGVDAAATAATAAGHGYAGAALKMAGGAYSRARESSRSEATDTSDDQPMEGGEKDA